VTSERGEPREPGEREPDDVDEIIEELAEHPDLPEADVVEQHQNVVAPSRPDRHLRADVPEADALEQAIPVDDDDEYRDV
jgi:hypothetical protein